MLFNLSLRYKLPLLGGALILTTALALSASFLVQSWNNLRQDMLKSSEDLGQTMARSLFTALLHDDVWRAYETIALPFKENSGSALAEALIVLDAGRRVFASSHPEDFPVTSELADLGDDFRAIDADIAADPAHPSRILERDVAAHLFIAIPISADNVRIGTLIVAHNKNQLWHRFDRVILNAAAVTLLILAVLLPINWYWGRRMVAPLELVTDRLSRINAGELAPLDPHLYPYHDEVGTLYLAYGRMLDTMQEKLQLEQEVVKQERMAAVGRLTASIAHEINNPLGGMLNAISTLKRHGSPDPLNQKTISLLERGLSQIRDTVAALLVEAKVSSRGLRLHDIDDVMLLVTPAAHKQGVEIAWETRITDPLPVPSTPVRQLLINLVLNAVQAAGRNGHVAVWTEGTQENLTLVVENDGQVLSAEHKEHLFEPFTPFSQRGNGLGLWICYQIATQLGGAIRAETTSALTRFIVTLPLDPRRDESNESNEPYLPD